MHDVASRCTCPITPEQACAEEFAALPLGQAAVDDDVGKPGFVLSVTNTTPLAVPAVAGR